MSELINITESITVTIAALITNHIVSLYKFGGYTFLEMLHQIDSDIVALYKIYRLPQLSGSETKDNLVDFHFSVFFIIILCGEYKIDFFI